MVQKRKAKSKSKPGGAARRVGAVHKPAGEDPARRGGRPQEALYSALIAIMVALEFKPKNVHTTCGVVDVFVRVAIKLFELKISAAAAKTLVEKTLRRKCVGEKRQDGEYLKTGIMGIPYEELCDSEENRKKVMDEAKKYGWGKSVEFVAKAVLHFFQSNTVKVNELAHAYAKLNSLTTKERKATGTAKKRLCTRVEACKDRIEQELKTTEHIAYLAMKEAAVSSQEPEILDATEDAPGVAQSPLSTTTRITRSRAARNNLTAPQPKPGPMDNLLDDPMTVDVKHDVPELPTGVAKEEGGAGQPDIREEFRTDMDRAQDEDFYGGVPTPAPAPALAVDPTLDDSVMIYTDAINYYACD